MTTAVYDGSRVVSAGPGGRAGVAGGSNAAAAVELSRASRTLLSKHGFTDVMGDTVASMAQAQRNADDPMSTGWVSFF